nr:hypothetical protein [Tanacetum cinerariifolium]
MINKKKFSLDVDMFREILQICPKILGQEFEDLLLEQDIISFISDLGHTRDITYLIDIENKDAKKTNQMSYHIFTKIIIDYLISNDQYISRRNKMFWHTARDDTVFTSMRCVSIHEKTQVYGAILSKELTNQEMLESEAYKTYYAFASEEKTPKPKSKEDFHISHASGSGDGVDTQSKVLDEQQQKTSGADEGTEDDDEDNFEDDADKNDDDSDDIDENDELTDDEHIHDEENINEKEKDEVTKKLYDDVNVNLGNKDTKITNADQEVQHNALLSPSTLQLIMQIIIPEITSSFTTPNPPPPPFFNPLSQQATPTPTTTASKTTTSLPALADFASVFKFNERVTNLEKDLSEIKQVDQYAQALSSIPAIVDRYMDNKLGEATNKAIKAHNFDYVATPVIKKNFTKSLEVAIFTRSSSQPRSSYKAATTLSEFELTKILIDKMEKNKSFVVADYKRDLYDALIKSYNTDKDISESYEEPSHNVEDSGIQQDQEFVTRDNDEQPTDNEVTKADWFKKPKRPLTPDHD